MKFTESQITGVLSSYAFSGEIAHDPGLMLYGLPAAGLSVNLSQKERQPLVDDLIKQLIEEGYVLPWGEEGVSGYREVVLTEKGLKCRSQVRRYQYTEEELIVMQANAEELDVELGSVGKSE